MASSPYPPPSPGGHAFAPAFDSTLAAGSPPPRRRSRRGIALTLTTIGAVVIAGAIAGGVHVSANLGYDEALAAFEDAADDAETARTELTGSLDALALTQQTATSLSDADTGLLLDATTKDALTSSLDAAATTAESTASVAESEIPTADEKPGWAWELFDETAQLNDDRSDAEDLTGDFESAVAEIETADEAVAGAGLDVLAAVATAADGFESGHISARNTDIISFRAAAAVLDAHVDALDGASVSAYSSLESAAAAMIASEKAEIAEKQGPLYNARVEIEAFARGLAPGVLLDFDWSDRVNGYGEGDSMGGLATWWYGDPGYSTIELSNSVAAYWPSDRSKALVAHEVGHSISVRCSHLYDDSNQDTIEAWATAWAISMGYTDDANGTWAYGAPPQSLIDAAAVCR